MKLNAQISDEKFEVEVKTRDGRVFAKVDGRRYELEASNPEPNIYLLKHNGKIYEVFVSPEDGNNGASTIRVGTQEFVIDLTDPKRLRGTGSDDVAADGVVEIKTAMPGKVVRILLGENSEVSAGEGVVIVEAMKMQNEMKSPKDGVIKEVKFSEGDTVNAGDVLVVIE